MVSASREGFSTSAMEPSASSGTDLLSLTYFSNSSESERVSASTAAASPVSSSSISAVASK